jgi:hypothetical protein
MGCAIPVCVIHRYSGLLQLLTPSSACAMLVEPLRHQGKVKSIAFGGLPGQNSMQAVGGTRVSGVPYIIRRLRRTMLTRTLIGFASYVIQ